MSSNETDTPADPALRQAEAARDAVIRAMGDYVDRLAALSRAARNDLDADLQAAGRLITRNTHRQLAANLTLVRRMMEARSLPALLQLQQEFLQRQAQWAVRDWERMSAQALALLQEGRQAAALERPEPQDSESPDSTPPSLEPPGPDLPGSDLPGSDLPGSEPPDSESRDSESPDSESPDSESLLPPVEAPAAGPPAADPDRPGSS